MQENIKNYKILLKKLGFIAIATLLFAVPYLYQPFAKVSSGVAILFGVLFSLLWGNPFLEKSKILAPKLLSYSIIGLGFGMNLLLVVQVGLRGLGYTFVGLCTTLFLGFLLGRFLKVEKHTSLLISFGTAICGGSAIAALAPAIKAPFHSISIALVVVFLLNAVALFLFPFVGHYFLLNEVQFGVWSAIAIHDTSSVVGAAVQYGTTALEVGTTVKLARALWIVPATFLIAFLYARTSLQNSKNEIHKIKKPWFILGFLLAAFVVTFFPDTQPLGITIRGVAEKLLTVTLFLIGAGVSKAALKEMGIFPFLHGFLLWILVSILSILFVKFQFAHNPTF